MRRADAIELQKHGRTDGDTSGLLHSRARELLARRISAQGTSPNGEQFASLGFGISAMTGWGLFPAWRASAAASQGQGVGQSR